MTPANPPPLRGLFLTLEGAEGSGKSTQARMLAAYLEEKGKKCLLTREPGGTPLAELLRNIVKGYEGPEKVHPVTELLLVEAARAQHVRERIRPALEAGVTVICDRFSDSTTAYQGGGRQLDRGVIERLNAFAMDGCIPDRTFFLDLTPEAGFRRTAKRVETQGEYDRFEAEALQFHTRVREVFEEIAAREPERIRVVNAEESPEEIHRKIRELVDELL